MTARSIASGYPPHRVGAPARAGAFSALLPLLPAILLFYSTLLPPEVRITFADQNLYAPRLVGLVLLPWLLFQAGQGKVPFKPIDTLVFLGSFWMIFSFVLYYGVGAGFLRGAALAVDVMIPYLVARKCIRDLTDLRRLLVLLVPGVIAVGLLLFLESVSHRLVVRPFAASLFGPLPSFAEGEALGVSSLATDVRFGLLRAYGPFSHPILGGLFMASMLPLYLMSGLRGWPLILGVAAGAFAIFSGSSAAYLFLILAVVLVVYDQVQLRANFLNWPLFIAVVIALLVIIDSFSQNGIGTFLANYTLTPHTAQYRLLIWEYGTRSVAEYPLIGIGFTSYEKLPWMGESIDNHWLLLAIRHGALVPLCFLAQFMVVLYRLGTQAKFLPKGDRLLQIGMNIAFFLLILLGLTVAYFGSSLAWFFMVAGIATSLAYRDPPRAVAGPLPA